jgi:hypothetical protein
MNNVKKTRKSSGKLTRLELRVSGLGWRRGLDGSPQIFGGLRLCHRRHRLPGRACGHGTCASGVGVRESENGQTCVCVPESESESVSVSPAPLADPRAQMLIERASCCAGRGAKICHGIAPCVAGGGGLGCRWRAALPGPWQQEDLGQEHQRRWCD